MKPICQSICRALPILGTVLLISLVAGCSERLNDQVQETAVTLDGATGAVGMNVSRPQWLPAWLALPVGLQINAAANDPKFGESTVYGSVPQTAPNALASSQQAMLTAANFALTDRSKPMKLRATHADGRYIEINLQAGPSGGTYYQLELHEQHSKKAIRALQRANAFTGNGRLSVTIGNQKFVQDGSCSVEGPYVKFLSETGNTELQGDAQKQAHSLRGTIAYIQGQDIKGWTIATNTPGGLASAIKVERTGFTFEGGLFNVMQSNMVEGALAMVCTPISG